MSWTLLTSRLQHVEFIFILRIGSNGIGQGIIKLLAKTRYPQRLYICATSRSGLDLKIQPLPPNEIRYVELNISDTSSIRTFISNTLQKDSKIDVLINNNGETPELTERTVNINYYGTKEMCQLFLTQGEMNKTPNSRIVNVNSTASSLSNNTSPIQSRFPSVKSVSVIDALAQEYIYAVKSQKQEEAGFGAPPKSYQVSKAFTNALTLVLARDNEGVAVNCCCPGWVDSDMGNQIGKPPKTLEEGARIPVRLGIGDSGEGGNKDGGLDSDSKEKVSGRYFGNDGVRDKGWRESKAAVIISQ
ncbi:hypothetical protein COCC4DRAFT_62071 [Bipolaris maydis ATCC 48331]|uniref:NAD(P)-binding protein n=2 Tax=Cochliobolus heterostrophus TaxID=5016 RepID=M2TYN9_COCH5|nr:uncharacterized protein COCC4DRAFT_62071 [Bipolaris maydis ATCC 48331]EMD86946.1 hypothetical protein COCHEDRAFT_1217949 [Bipolaris maydis C5]ENI04059.1 hypothetical protein COCC4DRAFT_62071 [Bipolaris maydis ATCC 48331]KAJ6204273.1 hypothetical protein PSV09DRAFT_1217949 [Bipolaris maydis]KAJ6265807.1 hypothetical protein PSV08DRAFT_356854 [Bipolaris maydis]